MCNICKTFLRKSKEDLNYMEIYAVYLRAQRTLFKFGDNGWHTYFSNTHTHKLRILELQAL